MAPSRILLDVCDGAVCSIRFKAYLYILYKVRKGVRLLNRSVAVPNLSHNKKESISLFLKKYGILYLFVLPGLLYIFIFKILPLVGLVIAFKDYQPSMGFSGIFTSQWAGLKHFKKFMGSYYFAEIMRNTLVISFTKFLIGFPLPVLIAIMLNSLNNKYFRKFSQTVCYMPNFMSWVVISGIVVAIFSTDGAVNDVLRSMGLPAVSFLNKSDSFFWIIIGSDVWKYAGWDSIIYLAAITAINPELYEAAALDGAGKLKQIWHVTLPGITSVIAITLVLRMGGILEAGFEQILLLYSESVYDVADILDTYVYREGLQMANYSFSTAVGLFKSVLAFIMVLFTNFISKRVSGEGLW